MPTPVFPFLQSHTRVRYSSFTFKTKGIVRKYCTGTNVILNPWFVTGLSDGSKKALVIWGTNFSSSVGYERFSKQVSNMIVLAPYQYSIIIGLVSQRSATFW